MNDLTQRIYETEAAEPFLPNRMRRALVYVRDDLMPEAFGGELGQWLHANRHLLERGGDDIGSERFNWERTNVDNDCPQLIAPFRRALIEEASKPEALKALAVAEFDVRHIEIHATLYHAGSHFTWHDDAPGYDGEMVPSRRITFAYYLHSTPKMFEGGELEFLDGQSVEPKNNRLCLFHPVQQHRVRKVECWSAHVLHGRWALMGWIHGDPPPGYEERLPVLRGIPRSG